MRPQVIQTIFSSWMRARWESSITENAYHAERQALDGYITSLENKLALIEAVMNPSFKISDILTVGDGIISCRELEEDRLELLLANGSRIIVKQVK